MKVNANILFAAGFGLVVLVIAAIFTKNENLSLIMGFSAPWITVLFAAAGINKTVEEVKEKVNGNFSVLTTRNQVLEAQILEIAKKLTPGQAQAMMTEPIPVVTVSPDSIDEEGRHRA